MSMTNSDKSSKCKAWFITGASSGFGRLLAEYLLETGHHVVATARQRDTLQDFVTHYAGRVLTLGLDVTKQSHVDGAIKDTLAMFGCIDVLVNNAGYGVTGAVEEVAEQEYWPMFDTNVFGTIRMTKAWLPYLREQRHGHIVNLSSIGGLVGMPGWGYYNATKFAVEGFSEALAAEVKPLGITVTIVEPGPFRTDFLGRSGVQAKARMADYAQTAGKTREYFETQSGKQAGDPQRAVEAIVAAVESPEPPLHLLLGRLALERYRAKAQSFADEVAKWENTTLGADFPEAAEVVR